MQAVRSRDQKEASQASVDLVREDTTVCHTAVCHVRHR